MPCVYAACGNNVLKEMLESLKNKARPLALRITPILPELLEDHREIVRALRRQGSRASRKRRSGNITGRCSRCSWKRRSNAPESNNR